MPSPNKNMAQKILTEILKYYNIIPSVVQSATNTHLLQESAVDIPEGIPALLAYSENYSKRHSLEKTLMRSFLGRHAGTLTDLRLVVTACGLIYLSRPIIGPILSSAWEELSHDVDEWITGSNHNTDFEPHPKPETVSITVAELKELNNFADAIQVRLDEAKTRQEDLLTANCDLEDDVERLENDVEKLKRVAEDDAAHSDARIRALNDQIDIEKDSRVTVWNERERFRLGGKDLKKQLENLQAEYNELEDDRDEWREKAEEVALELQGELNEMTADRDSLQTTVTQLETDKQTLESSLAQKLADPKASDDRQAELEKSAAETAKALSDATTARQAQDKRIEELEAFKSQQEESAAKTAKALSDAAATKQAQDKRIEELEAFKSQKEKSEAEAESLAEKTDVQADLAAEDVEKADKGQIERLRVQLNVERASYRSVFRRKQIFRYGCKKLKKELEALQARCNELEDSQNTWKETCEALEKQTDVKAVKALRDQIASDNAHNERRIEALETQLGFEKSNREDAQKMARGLRDRVRELKDELKDAITENENLELSYEELDHMHGAEEKANEDKDEEITNLKAEYDRLEAKFTALNERNIQLNAEGTGTAETAAVEEEDESRQNDGTILQQPEDSKATDAEEEIPLRRVQSAPLWLPLPHHGDSFDLMYDVSDYGDDDRDQEYGNEDRDGHQGSHDDEHDSGNNDGDGPGEDDNNDDDEPDDGRNGGADKVATDADLAQEDHVANSPGLSDNTTSSNLPLNNGQPPGDLPVPESSLQRASFTMNASALDFVPSVCPKRPVPPILPQHQAYIASQQGVNSSDSGSGSPSPHPKFRIYSAAKPGTLSPEASFHGPIHYQDPFPQLYDSPALQCDQLPEHTPAPKAAGPQEAKNPHVQKLNKEVKRLEWRRMSGMPDFFEDEDKERKGNPLSDDDIDGMYDRQVTQPLEFVAIDFAEESVWGLLDDIPNQTENVLMSSTPPILENRQTTGNGGPKTTDTSVTGVQNEEEHRVALVGASATAPEVPAEEKIPASSSTSRSQEATPRGRTTDGQSSTTLHNEKNADPDVNDEMSQATGENVNQEASKKNDESVETPKNAATHQTSGPDSSGMPEADEKFENNGEWSDVEDSDHEEAEEEDDSAPVLGNYKVTRGPTNNQDDNDVPMLGSHKVTRGPAPVNDGPGIPTLGKYKVTRGETPADDRSGVPEAEKKSGSDGEWSDVEDEEEEKKENGEEEGGARGFTPMNTNFVAMLGNHQVTRPSTPAKVNSGKEAEQNSRNNSQPSSPCPAPKRDPPQENVAASLPVPQSESPAQGTPVATTKAARDGKTAIRHTSDIFPSTKNTTKTHAEVVGDAFADYVREHGTRKLEDSMWADKPNANKQALPQQAPSTPAEGVAGEVTRGPPRPPANIRGPTNSQPPPGIPTGMRGHASPNHDPERSVSRFETSAEIEDPDTTPRVRLPSPPSYDPDNPNEIPRVRLPPWLKGFQARPAPVIPETAPSTQGELEEGPGPQMAPVGTQVARAFDPRSKPPYRGSPLRNEIRATSVEKNNAGTQHTPGAAPAGSASRSDGWFPRGNGRGGRGGLGGQGVRGAHTPVRQTATHGSTANTATATPIAPEAEDDFKILGASRRGDSGGNDGRGAHQAPAQSPPGNNTRAEPITPSADDGTQSPNFNVRGRGGGQAGRGGHRAGRQQQGPTVRLSTPNTPRAAPAATTNNDNHTPPAYRGGQNGQATPTPQPKPTRGSESANSSFRRQQEQMAKLAAESARKREARGGGKSVNSSFMRQQERMAQSAAEEARKGE